MDYEHCKWCGEDADINGLIGLNTNQCPKCGKPIFEQTFGSLKIGDVFETNEDGRFCKLDVGYAVCVENSYGNGDYHIGESVTFETGEPVYPY